MSGRDRVEHVMGGFYTFSREIERHGMAPGTRVLACGVEEADERVASALAVAPGSRVVALARLRLADDQPRGRGDRRGCPPTGSRASSGTTSGACGCTTR